MDAAARDRVAQLVYRAMGRWERENGHGSARPTFEQAWRDGCHAVGVSSDIRTREDVWRAWLAAGQPLTRTRMQALFADAMTRAKPGRDLRRGALGDVMAKHDREPGEDG